MRTGDFVSARTGHSRDGCDRRAPHCRCAVVRNQIDGCGLGEGIDVENSYITVENSVIRDIDRNGVVAVGGDTLFNNNSMHNVAGWGIWISGGNKSCVSNNTLSTQRGILLDGGATGVLVSRNVIGPFAGYGILLLEVEGNTVTDNQVDGSYAGIWLYRASKTMVTGNVLNHMYSFGIVDEVSGGGNSIVTNTINGTPKGIVVYNGDAGSDTLSPNVFNGVDVMTATSLW